MVAPPNAALHCANSCGLQQLQESAHEKAHEHCRFRAGACARICYDAIIEWLCGRRRPQLYIETSSVFLPLQFAKLNSHRVLGKFRSMNTCRVLSLLFLAVACSTLQAQTVNTFEGIDASQLTNPGFDIDPNGAVGTKQFMEWVNVAYQAYDKVTFAPVWSAPQAGATPWKNAGLTNCTADRRRWPC